MPSIAKQREIINHLDDINDYITKSKQLIISNNQHMEQYLNTII